MKKKEKANQFSLKKKNRSRSKKKIPPCLLLLPHLTIAAAHPIATKEGRRGMQRIREEEQSFRKPSIIIASTYKKKRRGGGEAREEEEEEKRKREREEEFDCSPPFSRRKHRERERR